MPTPQIKPKNSYREPTYTEQVFTQFQETRTELNQRMDRIERSLDTTRKELNQRMDRIEHRMDKLEEKLETTRRELNARMDKQEEKIERLADKIDAMHNELKSSTGHISIANISTVGIALGVLYSILSK